MRRSGAGNLCCSLSLTPRWSLLGPLSFLFNPYTIFTTLGRSTATFDNALVLLALSFGAQAYPTLALLVLALVTRTALYPALLLPALFLYLPPPAGPTKPFASRAARSAVLFVAFLSGLSMLERAIAGSWAAVFRNWSVILGIRDLTPNVGLSWCGSQHIGSLTQSKLADSTAFSPHRLLHRDV